MWQWGRHFFSWRNARIAAVLIAAALPLGWLARYIYFYVPLLELQPVCYDKNARPPEPNMRLVEGPVTREFVVAVADLASRHDNIKVMVRGTHAYLTISAWIDHGFLAEVLLGSVNYRRRIRWEYSASAAGTILVRRMKQGLITDEIRQEYMFHDKIWDNEPPRILTSGECGLLHELVIEGGRFARSEKK
jgi:hypothetical protein